MQHFNQFLIALFKISVILCTRIWNYIHFLGENFEINIQTGQDERNCKTTWGKILHAVSY